MFVNGVPFLVTMSRKIHLQTAEHIQTRTVTQLGSSLSKIVKKYARGGFTVNLILMNQEFDKLDGALGLVEINTTAAREHVGEIEQDIRTLKERCRTICSTLPYQTLPKQLVVHLVYYVAMCLNCIINKQGISDVLSPREIMLRRKLDYKRHFWIKFRSYVEAHEDPDITNTMRAHTYPGIYLGCMTNLQGTRKVFDLLTGVVKKPRSVTEFPIPDRVIKMVDAWGKRYQKEECQNKVKFLNCQKLKYDWENDELPNEGLLEDDVAHPDIPAEFPGLELENEMEVPGSAVTTIEECTADEAREAEDNTDLIPPPTEAPVAIDLTDNVDDIVETTGVQECDIKVENDLISDNVAKNNKEVLGTIRNNQGQRRSAQNARTYADGQIHLSYRGNKYLLNPHGKFSYDTGHLETAGVSHFNVSESVREAFLNGQSHVTVDSPDDIDMSDEDIYEHVLGVVMMQQFSLIAGLKRFGKDGEFAVTKELTQIHDMDTYIPVDSDKLTAKQKRKAMESLIFLTENHDGRIKSRMCGDGSKQRRRPGYKKEDTVSPTVSTDAVFLTMAIEVYERRATATFDIPGAFLHAYCEEGDIHMRLRGRLAELMVLVDPKLYRQYVRYSSHGDAVLYVGMTKAL